MSVINPQPDDHERFLQTRYFPSLDGLRALSIVPVIWHHCSLTPLPGVLGKGPAGVQLFFVISGFLVTTLLLRERDELGIVSLRRFYVRRALRIFPLYYLTLALVTISAFVSQPSAQRTHFFDSWWYHATYTSNWWVNWDVSHSITFAFAWTLAIEEQFYALWPPILRVSRSWLPAVLAMLSLLTLSQAAGLFPREHFFTTFCLWLSSSIALGSLLAFALHHPASFGLVRLLLGQRHAPTALLLLTGVELFLGPPHLVFHLTLCLLVGACVVAREHSLSPLLHHRWTSWVGRVSYGLYLTHFIAIGLARRIVDPEQPLLVFLMSLPVALGLAGLSYRWIESPALRLKKRFAATPPATA